jgi:hypothetical protein
VAALVWIEEISDRADQGMTQPWRCRGEDGHSYFVKVGSSAGWRSLICEWVAGRLAERFGLPMAPFAQVYLDVALVAPHRQLGHLDLSPGEAFGSRLAPRVREFDPILRHKCSATFRRDLVAFDWWIRNADRTLGEISGNPNLLWSTEPPPGLVVIDHNLAFDPDFDADRFSTSHIFAADFEQIRADMFLRADYQQRFTRLLPMLPDIWAELPDNWVHTEDGLERLSPSDIETLLRRVEHDGFWHLLPPLPPEQS